MLPKFLEVLNEALGKGELPASMTEATIIVIPKEGKDPVQPASYRPIFLLCTEVKILAKVQTVQNNSYYNSPRSMWFHPG